MSQPLYTITGTVVHGKKRGKDLGYPTANIMLQDSIPEGIYISETRIDSTTHHSVTFIGAAETFAETEYKSETYILDFNATIYDREITVWLVKKIRDSERFTTIEALIENIKSDVSVTRRYFIDRQTQNSRS